MSGVFTVATALWWLLRFRAESSAKGPQPLKIVARISRAQDNAGITSLLLIALILPAIRVFRRCSLDGDTVFSAIPYRSIRSARSHSMHTRFVLALDANHACRSHSTVAVRSNCRRSHHIRKREAICSDFRPVRFHIRCPRAGDADRSQPLRCTMNEHERSNEPQDESLDKVPLTPVESQSATGPGHFALGAVVFTVGAGALFLLLLPLINPAVPATRSARSEVESRQLQIEQAERELAAHAQSDSDR